MAVILVVILVVASLGFLALTVGNFSRIATVRPSPRLITVRTATQQEVREILSEDGLVAAVKRIRAQSGISLLEAKVVSDGILSGSDVPATAVEAVDWLALHHEEAYRKMQEIIDKDFFDAVRSLQKEMGLGQVSAVRIVDEIIRRCR
ncbi:hypothetical protein ABZY09_20665 [Streptomyces sp. NPDC002928]|uniref:hypothetical protein n=1 Tax=Streptomyces sp. NPDC002928 TaxID=3154440 RepID=UPI0033B03A2B